MRAWYVKRGFLMYKRRRRTKNVWYSNDTLIAAWEMRECERQAKIHRPRLKAPY